MYTLRVSPNRSPVLFMVLSKEQIIIDHAYVSNSGLIHHLTKNIEALIELKKKRADAVEKLIRSIPDEETLIREYREIRIHYDRTIVTFENKVQEFQTAILSRMVYK